MPPRQKPRLTVKTWHVVSEAVETGVAYGLMRAYKYPATPNREALTEHLAREVMTALAEVSIFD